MSGSSTLYTDIFLVNLNQVSLKLNNISSLNAWGEQFRAKEGRPIVVHPRYIPHLAEI